jgi:hypothetical protein
MKPWVEALELVRGERSKRSLEMRGGMPSRQYREMLTQSTKGPTVVILTRMLAAWGVSWEQFGRVYDGVLARQGAVKAVKRRAVGHR